jgi:hypothetical protein
MMSSKKNIPQIYTFLRVKEAREKLDFSRRYIGS